jgi:hypothetical protein
MTSMAGRARRSLLAAVLLAGLAVSCASGSEGTSDDEAADDTTGSTTPTTVADAPLAGAEAVAAAEERLQPWIEGTMRPPPDDGPPATDGAEIYVVSCGQLLESCTILVDGVMEAAGEAGWDATLVDTALDFSAAGGAIRQAMAAGADGAIVVGVDCQHFAGALDEANAADFPVVVLNAFDCDVTSDGAEPARFSAQVDFTEGDEDPVDNARRFAAAKVDWGVIETDADLQVINMVQDDLLASQLLGEGFAEGVTTCSSCSVVDTITFSTGPSRRRSPSRSSSTPRPTPSTSPTRPPSPSASPASRMPAATTCWSSAARARLRSTSCWPTAPSTCSWPSTRPGRAGPRSTP